MPADRDQLRAEIRTARDEIYRSRILEAAERIFAEQGYEGARMKDIGAAAGLAMGTLYGIFQSKDDVFQAVHEERAGELFAQVADLLEDSAGPADIILRGVDATVRFFCAYPDYLRMHLWGGVGWASDQQPTERQSDTWLEGVNTLASVFEEGAENGQLHSSAPHDDARIVMAMLQVKLSSYLASESPPPVDAVVADLQALVGRTYLVEPRA